MKTSSIVWIIIAVVVVGGGALWYYSGNSNKEAGEYGTPTSEQNEYGSSAPAQAPGLQSAATPDTGANSGEIAAPAAPQTHTITYDGTSFSPASITVKIGDTVTFMDSSSNPMWVAADVHPTHTLYDGTDLTTHCAAGYSGPTPFDECAVSTNSYSFTFTKAGTWPYHDHVNASATGKVIVQ